jgi:polygalacturonase
MHDEEAVKAIESATVSPLSAGIKPAVNGRRVSFTIAEPGSYTVQFNGSSHRAVHIFANPFETDIPDRNDPNVIWIEPGEWTITDGMGLKSGQTLYISGGAVVHTTVNTQFAENVQIRGRGIIDGSRWDTWRGTEAHVPIDFRYCSNVYVEGIILHNPNAWTFNSFETTGALVENVKILSARPNGDGFTLQSCRDYTVQNSFARTWDDTCVVKNYGGNSNNVTFKNMVLWTDLAQSCEVGYETNKGRREGAVISNILFEDITIINAFHKPAMSIHNADDALVENVTYRNVTVENAAMGMGDARDNRQLMDLTVASSGWSSTPTRGSIRNVLFENINVLAGTSEPTLRFNGYDDEHAITGVKIKGLTVFGEKITSLDTLNVTTRYAEDVTLE